MNTVIKEDIAIETSKLNDSDLISPAKLPVEIANFSKLKFLDLSGTEIEVIPKELLQLNKLETLHLSGSKIKIDEFVNDIIGMSSL